MNANNVPQPPEPAGKKSRRTKLCIRNIEKQTSSPWYLCLSEIANNNNNNNNNSKRKDTRRRKMPGTEESSSTPPTCLTIGGVKGHVVETIQRHTLRLYNTFRWKMIPKCTGRYTCRDHTIVRHLTPSELLQMAGVVVAQRQQKPLTFDLEGRTDLIMVLPLDKTLQTGIITYLKEEKENNGGTMELRRHYVHTLNAPSGFQRKLRAIGINLSCST